MTNVLDRTCSCPDWKEKRQGFGSGEPMRLCKHLVRAVVDKGLQHEYGSEAWRLERAAEKGIAYYPRPDDQVNDGDEELASVEGRRKWLGRCFNTLISEGQERAVAAAFGGEGYPYNFLMYLSRVEKGPITLHVPKGDHYRWRFEVLARTGVARRGTALTPVELLEGLGMQDLRAMAAGSFKFRRKVEGIAKLAEKGPLIANHLPSGFFVDDFFRLEPLSLSQIEKRWG